MAKLKPKKTNAIPSALIAPCGLNCRLCRAYIRDRNTCPGCRGDDRLKSKTCVTCKIKNCEQITIGKSRYCFVCNSFPCEKLNHLDKRYRLKYGMSPVENLHNIKKFGIRHYLRNEKKRWACPQCGEMICVHQPLCLSCEYKWR
jgi:Protein of unknown function (DUF3795)